MITEDYKNILIEKHKEANWGITGIKHIEQLDPLLREMYSGCSILDYGCGKGVLLEHLQNAMVKSKVVGYDPAMEKYNKLPEQKFDLIISTDVFEHIEPEHLDAVLTHLQDLQAPEGRLFFVVFTREAANILPDGRNAHLIIKTAEWWLNKLREYFPAIVMTSKTPVEVTFVS